MKLQNICLFTSTILVCGMTSISYAQEKLGNVGIVFNDGIRLNKTVVDVIEYVGTCPGSTRERIVGWFRDKEVSTQKKRRVRITNEKFADISNKIPYTDRKYKKNGRSQKIGFDFGTNHRGSRFVVKPGVNQFNYVIYDGKYGKSNMQIIKRGSFSVEVNPNYKKYQRDIQWRNTPRFVCLNLDGEVMQEITQEDFDKCKFRGSQKVGSCNGATIYGKVKPLRKTKDFE